MTAGRQANVKALEKTNSPPQKPPPPLHFETKDTMLLLARSPGGNSYSSSKTLRIFLGSLQRSLVRSGKMKKSPKAEMTRKKHENACFLMTRSPVLHRRRYVSIKFRTSNLLKLLQSPGKAGLRSTTHTSAADRDCTYSGYFLSHRGIRCFYRTGPIP